MEVTLVTRETVSGIVKLYPHLKTHDVYELFKAGKLTLKVKKQDDYEEKTFFVHHVYELEIPGNVAALHNVDTKIELTPGEEGLFYSFTY